MQRGAEGWPGVVVDDLVGPSHSGPGRHRHACIQAAIEAREVAARDVGSAAGGYLGLEHVQPSPRGRSRTFSIRPGGTRLRALAPDAIGSALGGTPTARLARVSPNGFHVGQSIAVKSVSRPAEVAGGGPQTSAVTKPVTIRVLTRSGPADSRRAVPDAIRFGDAVVRRARMVRRVRSCRRHETATQVARTGFRGVVFETIGCSLPRGRIRGGAAPSPRDEFGQPFAGVKVVPTCCERRASGNYLLVPPHVLRPP
jgi:hypothetical protein